MAALTYYNLIPQASDRLRDSQSQILQNFTSLQSFLEINHTAFSDGNSGKHKFLQMPEEAAAPTTLPNEMGLYTKEGSVSGVSELFVRRENDGTEINITNDVLKNANGYTRLPNGLIVKWGKETVTKNSLSSELTFDTTVAFASAPYMVLANQTFSAGPNTDSLQVTVSTGDYTVTGFKAYARAIGIINTSTAIINYIAIGI